MRGAEVALLTCGGGQPACEMGWGRNCPSAPVRSLRLVHGHARRHRGGALLPARRPRPVGCDAGRAPQRPTARAARGDVTDPYAASAISVPWFLRTTRPDRVPEGAQATEDFAVAAASGRGRGGEGPGRVRAGHRLHGQRAVRRRTGHPRSRAAARPTRADLRDGSPRRHTRLLAGRARARLRHRRRLGPRPRPAADGEQAAAVAELLGDRARGVGAHERYFDATARTTRSSCDGGCASPTAHASISLFTNLSWDSATIGHDIGYPPCSTGSNARCARAERSTTSCSSCASTRPSRTGERGRRSRLRSSARSARCQPTSVSSPRPRRCRPTLCSGMSDLVLSYTTTVGLEAAFRRRAGRGRRRHPLPRARVHARCRAARAARAALRDADGRMDPAARSSSPAATHTPSSSAR